MNPESRIPKKVIRENEKDHNFKRIKLLYFLL